MLKKIFSDSFIYGLAPHISKIASFFVLPIITKDLTDFDYGVAGIISAFTGAFTVLSSLGLRVVLANAYFKSPSQYKWIWRQIYGFLSLWMVPYAIIISIVIYFAVPQGARSNTMEIILLNVVPIVFFGQTATICATYYQLKQQSLQIGVRTAIFGIIAVFLNLYTISYLKMGYMGWFWTTFLVAILSNISYWFPLNKSLGLKPIFNFKWRSITKSLKVSLPTIPHHYSSYLLDSSDRMVMTFLNTGAGDIGKYNLAYSFGNYYQSFATGVNKAIGPVLLGYYKKKELTKAKNLIFLVQSVFFALSFLICIWLKEAFHFLIKNDTLNKMYPLAIIIIMGYNSRPMYVGSNQQFFYYERTDILWKVSFVAGLSNVVLNVIMIPIFGYEAAAFTTFISLLYLGYASYFFKAFKAVSQTRYYPIAWILISIAITALAYIVVEFPMQFKIYISIALFGFCFLLFFKYKYIIDSINE